MTPRRLARIAPVAVAVAILVSGCGGGSNPELKGTNGSAIAAAANVTVPPTVLGLTLSSENVAQTVASTPRTYVDSLVLYGLRQDNLLEATFQVARFNPGNVYTRQQFRLEMVDQIGSALPVTLDVAGTTVYLTEGNRQRIYVWFANRFFFVLACRQDYQTPRSLLRQLLMVQT